MVKTVDEKLGIMEKEYSIAVDDRIREDVSAMCNLSQGIRDNTLVDDHRISSIVSQVLDAVSGMFRQAFGTDMTAIEEYVPFVSKAFTVRQNRRMGIITLKSNTILRVSFQWGLLWRLNETVT